MDEEGECVRVVRTGNNEGMAAIGVNEGMAVIGVNEGSRGGATDGRVGIKSVAGRGEVTSCL